MIEVTDYTKTFWEYELDGKRICFHKSSRIEIQVGKSKSSYKTRHSFLASSFPQAVLIYNGINIGNGFKKRLICKTLNKPVLARSIS
jgi:hypothetical protein